MMLNFAVNLSILNKITWLLNCNCLCKKRRNLSLHVKQNFGGDKTYIINFNTIHVNSHVFLFKINWLTKKINIKLITFVYKNSLHLLMHGCNTLIERMHKQLNGCDCFSDAIAFPD